MSAEIGGDEGRLYDGQGQRKYLDAREARRLLTAAASGELDTDLFCQLLYYTGCRITEALAVTPRRLDLSSGCVVFRTLKRRKRTFRHVPVPVRLLRALAQRAEEREPDAPLFPWSRQTGWRRIKGLMDRAGIAGPQATAKGLRHQFGIHAIGRQIPESAVGRWLGHANAKSTRIYTCAVGAEERALARRMW